MKLEFDGFLDVIAEELDRVVDLATESPHVLVPAHPGWRTDALVAYLTEACVTWRHSLGSGSYLAVDEVAIDQLMSARTAPELLIIEGDRLLGALRAAGTGFEIATDGDESEEVESEFDSDDLARVAALTCAVYRSDLDRATSGPGRIETELAVDGIAERLDAFCELERGSWEGSMCLIALDAPEAWMLEGRRGRCSWRMGRGPAVTAVVGHASDLLLYAWGRLTPDDLAVTGDFRIARAWGGVRG